MKTFATLLLFVLASALSAVPWADAMAGDVVFRVVDQYGDEIPGSTIYVLDFGPSIETGDVVSMSDGHYQVQLRPGVLGGQPRVLLRYDEF
jgi:hypothetical protein